MSKKKLNTGGVVYSTDPGFKFPEDADTVITFSPAEQKLRVRLEHRAGKAVTLVKEFRGKEEDMQELGKKLKSFCGTGGSVKDGEIIVQGNNKDKVLQWLLKNGYSNSKMI